MARLVVITGPMFSGKSDELIKLLNIALHGEKNVVVFKPKKDTRRPESEVYSRKKKNKDTDFEKASSFPAHIVSLPKEAQDLIDSNKPDIVALDEGQFFDISFAEFVKKLLKSKKYRNLTIIISGLDMTSEGDPFPGPMPQFMAMAHEIVKLKAVCFKCKEWPPTAEMTYYKGKKEDPVLVGDASSGYEARCRNCHESSSQENQS